MTLIEKGRAAGVTMPENELYFSPLTTGAYFLPPDAVKIAAAGESAQGRCAAMLAISNAANYPRRAERIIRAIDAPQREGRAA
ncbi:MAG: hypothetical protein Aurels2KO_54260 [Aureliella sp.]